MKPRRCCAELASGRQCSRPASIPTVVGPCCAQHAGMIMARRDDDGGGDGTMSDLLNQIMDRPEVQQGIAKVQAGIDRVMNTAQQALAESPADPFRAFQRLWQKDAASTPPPPGTGRNRATTRENPHEMTRERALRVLGIAPSATVTDELVKQRVKKLAQLFHPDQGGHPDAMVEVNLAAKVLRAGK